MHISRDGLTAQILGKKWLTEFGCNQTEYIMRIVTQSAGADSVRLCYYLAGPVL